MSLEQTVEAVIRDAMERGEFDHLRGEGKPVDLSAYFETPAELRLAYTALKNAGMVPEEVELLKEMSSLREELAAAPSDAHKYRIRRLLSEKQMRFGLLTDRRRR